MLRFGTKLLGRVNGLLTQVKFHISENDIPYTTNPYWMTRKQKRFIEIKPIKHESWNDELKYPGDLTDIQTIAMYVKTHDPTNYSLTTIATLIYNLSKYNAISVQLFQKLQPEVPKFLGESNDRVSYGLLYGAIKYDRKQLMDFVLNEVKIKQLRFTADEGLEIIDALEVTTMMNQEQKLQFWYAYFFPSIQSFLPIYQDNNPRRVMKVLKQLMKLQVYDEVVWQHMCGLLHNKRGWVRVEIYEFLYPHLERFPFLQELVDTLHEQIVNNVDMRWRYNIEQRRMFTNQQMMDKSQDNIQLIPEIRTLFKQNQIQELTRKHEQLKQKGTLEQEAQLEQDRARALSYVLYDKFKKEATDRNLFDPAEFERLYGMTEEEINNMIAMKDKLKEAKELSDEIEQDQEAQGVDEEGHVAIETGGEGDTQEKVEKAPVDPNAEEESEEQDSEEEDD